MSDLLRHVRTCDNAVLPGTYLRLTLGSVPVGWVSPATADVLRGTMDTGGGSIAVPDMAVLRSMVEHLADRGLFRPRREAFDVRSDVDGAVLGQLDRGAFPLLGLRARYAHLHGLVRRDDGLHVWVGRRAAHKELGPGKLDHIAAGGIAAGSNPFDTLVREAAEEAGIPTGLTREASPVAVFSYATERPEGVRRETMHVFDLRLPEDFRPTAVDGEVAGFELWPIGRVLDAVRHTEDFLYDVNLALVDLLLRQGCIPCGEAEELRAALDRLSPAQEGRSGSAVP